MKAYPGGRTTISTILAVGTTLAVLLAGRGGPSAHASASMPAKATLVYFIFTGFTYPYFAPMAQGVTAAAKQYPNLNIKTVSASNSASTEITDINEAIASGAKGIILNPVQESVTHAAQQAMSKGIPVITIDRDVANVSARLAFIGDKDVVLGQIQTQYGLKYLASHHVRKPWHVVILQGTLGASTAIDRLNGALQVLKPYTRNGSVKIVFNQSANFMTSVAQSMISELLAKTRNIQLIICGNDAMALGAIRALKDHGLTPGKSVFVVGADAQPESMRAIKDGTQLDTVTHSPYLEAVWAVEAMSNYLQSKINPPADKFPQGNVIIPMTLVTRANVGKIAAWGTPSTIPPLPYGHASPLVVH
jgi:ABC-type sugar transport system substrate-binding protein